jgi:hypothetical protein
MDAIKTVHFAYFCSLIKYGIIFRGNSCSIKKVFVLQKGIIRILIGVGLRCSCKGLFKILNILPVPCECVCVCARALAIMIFTVKNLDKFQSNSVVHETNIRTKHQLLRPLVNLSCIQKGVYCCSIRTFNSLPPYILEFKK